jgi:hypothetical protein
VTTEHESTLAVAAEVVVVEAAVVTDAEDVVVDRSVAAVVPGEDDDEPHAARRAAATTAATEPATTERVLGSLEGRRPACCTAVGDPTSSGPDSVPGVSIRPTGARHAVGEQGRIAQVGAPPVQGAGPDGRMQG